MRHGNWKSLTTAIGYIDESNKNKSNFCDIITKSVAISQASTVAANTKQLKNSKKVTKTSTVTSNADSDEMSFS